MADTTGPDEPTGAHPAAGATPGRPGAGGAERPDATPPGGWGTGGVVGDGRYRLTRKLGRGGMAEVFAAEDVRLGREVAVKLLRPDLAEDPVSKARFSREAQSVAGLNHHAVVAVYDTGEDTGPAGTVPYIVMELVEGRTIRELLVGGGPPPTVDDALVIVSGVLEALAYSHAHGIVHRDIKPANVIITDTGAVKVMDFGIARALHGASTTMTQTGMVMGTPQYLSPEQALGKAVDTRSDLYATGCLLYELLALRPPFVGETPLSVVYQHVQDEPRPPSTVDPRVPPELDGLVLHALAKQPDDRFQTAEEMLGVVRYAQTMLREQGGHTGLWDTGWAAPVAGATPPMGTAAVGAAAGLTAATEPLYAREQGAYAFDTGTSAPGGGGGGRAARWALFVVAAIAAVGLGVWFAVQGATGGGGKPTTPKPASTHSAPANTGRPSDGGPSDQQTGTGGTSEQPSDQPTGSTEPSPSATDGSPSATPSHSAKPTPSSHSPGSTTKGGSNGGSSTTGGTAGKTNGGTTSSGAGTTGGGTTTTGTTGTTTSGTTDGDTGDTTTGDTGTDTAGTTAGTQTGTTT
jgi:tRNA A-37 threonylcarbamoyl transferase component Bud32